MSAVAPQDAAPRRAGSVDVAAAVKDAAITALITFLLFLPLVGFRTVQNMRNELELETRFPLLLSIVAIVTAAKLFWSLIGEPWRERRALNPAPESARTTAIKAKLAEWFTPFALGFVVVYPILIFVFIGSVGSLKWIDNFGIQILIYVMLGWGLNIVVGLAGLLDLGYVAFYAVGAYSYALLAKEFGFSFWILLPLAGVLSAFWGILLGFPVLRLRGDYLAIVTLAFGEIIRLVLINWVDFTGGYAGISGIPRPTLFGIPFTANEDGFAAVMTELLRTFGGWIGAAEDSFWMTYTIEHSPVYRSTFLYYVILALGLVTAYVTIRLRQLPVGRAWEALREDEIACRSLGINTTNTKLTAFAMGAMFAGFAGSFFAARQGFISPESFTFLESATILAIVVLGGMGSQIGVAVAAIVMIGGTEISRELDFLKYIFGNDFDPTQYRMLIFGLGMVLIMIWKPRGLVGTREPSAFLKEKRTILGSHVKEGHG
jgi:branched-chain amino acid transport system permease protein